MSLFQRGCSYYTMATVEVGFPEDHVVCDYCPFLETYSRKQCRRTGEYLMNTAAGIGFYCPLRFEDGDADAQKA